MAKCNPTLPVRGPRFPRPLALELQQAREPDRCHEGASEKTNVSNTGKVAGLPPSTLDSPSCGEELTQIRGRNNAGRANLHYEAYYNQLLCEDYKVHNFCTEIWSSCPPIFCRSK